MYQYVYLSLVSLLGFFYSSDDIRHKIQEDEQEATTEKKEGKGVS